MQTQNVTAHFTDIGVSGTVSVRDLLAHQDQGTASGSITRSIDSHSAVMLRLKPTWVFIYILSHFNVHGSVVSIISNCQIFCITAFYSYMYLKPEYINSKQLVSHELLQIKNNLIEHIISYLLVHSSCFKKITPMFWNELNHSSITYINHTPLYYLHSETCRQSIGGLCYVYVQSLICSCVLPQ